MLRGGDSANSTFDGIFRTYLFWNETSSGTNVGFRCAQNLPDLDSTTLTLTPSTTSINATWTSTGATDYVLIRGPANTEPTFVPVDGTGYIPGTQGSDTILVDGPVLVYNNSSLVTGSSYYYNLYSYDANDSYTFLARASEKPVSCAT